MPYVKPAKDSILMEPSSPASFGYDCSRLAKLAEELPGGNPEEGSHHTELAGTLDSKACGWCFSGLLFRNILKIGRIGIHTKQTGFLHYGN